MITFDDGPAKGQALMLHWMPRFLRVTQAGEKFDALEQPDDEPRRHETLFAYEITEQQGSCHIRASGGRGGFYPIGHYHLVTPQPSDAEMRTSKAWHQWCVQENARRPMP
jgi:hypothetical protein